MRSGKLAYVEDPDQKTTYAAEDMVSSWLDEVSVDTGEVRVAAQVYVPETEPRFSRPTEVTDFVERVMERLRVQAKQYGSSYRGREQRPVRVASHRGWKKATYRDGVIWLPQRERGGAWALRGFVVLHELAHHLNTGVDGTIIDAHGEGFRSTFVQLLEDIGWIEMSRMLRDAYQQVGLDRRAIGDDGMLAKVGKLLRHAEGASTEAERDAFFAKAQELATTHSIELAVARAAHLKGEQETVPAFDMVRLGHRGQPSNARFIDLMLAIARANDLRCTVRTDNTGVTLYGFPGDIEVTKALYVSLVVQMVADGDAYIRSGAHRPVHGRTARAAFYAGWANRIGHRLQEAQHRAQAKAGVVRSGRRSSRQPKALAILAKEVEVNDYYAQMARQHGVAGTWRGSGSVRDGHSVARGRAAAERARLGLEKQIGRR